MRRSAGTAEQGGCSLFQEANDTVVPRCLARPAVDAILEQAPVLPVLKIAQIDDAVPLARALAEGGLPVLEVTLRSDAALAAISLIRAEVPQAIVGAGTVLTPADLERVIDAGGMFAISPGATGALYAAAAKAQHPVDSRHRHRQ
jgi:2-dehydro-3-deoxyphosphogluconate aldolase / (4S)-4-hydroxy-2-oxoglutarate aldolase